ncbi:alpha/beta hydrolase [Nibrella saemangeumensis]|uniref:Alpha/beta hydrolase n=1 Tax=Nibrella saemangeumensis TaxID=1084526 RepID=A0ABP8N244_9BACT
MPDKPVLVLIHGHGVDASLWDGLYAVLSSEYPIIKPDFSGLTSHDTVEAYAEELYSLLMGAGGKQCVLIGHSMGGYIALAFADAHPEMLLGLGLFHSTAFADDEDRKAKRQQAIEKLENEGSRAFIEDVVPKMFADSNQERMADTLRQLVNKSSAIPAEALVAGIKAIRSRPDRTHVLKNARYPVLLIVGRQDNLVPFDKSQALFDMPADAETLVLENSGHLGMIEQPAETTQAIQEFLRRVEPQ